MSNARLGLGSVGSSGLLQGEVSVTESCEYRRDAVGQPLVEDEAEVVRRAASISFTTSDVVTGVTLENGEQTPVAVEFAFGGSGPAISQSISGVLTSAEYSFTERGIAVCKLEYEAIGGEVTAGTSGASGATADTVVMGLGEIAWTGAGSQLRGTLSIGASATFLPMIAGIPCVLQAREVLRAKVRVAASFAIFDGTPAVGDVGDLTFVHASGATFLVTDAILLSATTRYSATGEAGQACEWEGTALEVS